MLDMCYSAVAHALQLMMVAFLLNIIQQIVMHFDELFRFRRVERALVECLNPSLWFLFGALCPNGARLVCCHTLAEANTVVAAAAAAAKVLKSLLELAAIFSP